MNSYKELIVWQKSMNLVKKIYVATVKFPKAEVFGLSSQMRRAAISIPSNIAEGFNRKHPKEFMRFISIAFASGAELETQLELAKELRFIPMRDFEDCSNLLNEVMRMLNKMLNSRN